MALTFENSGHCYREIEQDIEYDDDVCDIIYFVTSRDKNP